ncbi:hypothetical protein ACJRO7_008612 [Eucalyptus globulus]|uniref:Uncharacterized protein n=1 Tax=Eucalyptus globulus TaxID=34317 RepID=A0ABD3ISP1_EUCGL
MVCKVLSSFPVSARSDYGGSVDSCAGQGCAPTIVEGAAQAHGGAKSGFASLAERNLARLMTAQPPEPYQGQRCRIWTRHGVANRAMERRPGCHGERLVVGWL